MFGIFLTCYSNYHLIFGMKYWTLSIKIESLMHHEQQISKRQSHVISACFWTLEIIVFGAGTISIFMLYGLIVTNKALQFLFTGCYIFVSLVSLLFVIDAFRRLKRCLEHDQLGISSRQIIIHVTVFSLSLLVMILFAGLSFKLK